MPIKFVDLKEMGRRPDADRTPLINGPHFHSWFHIYKPGQADEMHCHNADQTFYMIDGECTMSFPDGSESVLTPGMAALITGGSFYKLENRASVPMVMMGVRGRASETTKTILYDTREELIHPGQVKGDAPQATTILV